MKCPSCKNNELVPVEIEKGLIGAGCTACEGALLSLIQYRYWLDHHDDATLEEQGEDVVAVDSEGAKLCPKCSKMMTKYRIGYNTENRLDLCAHCDEAWLDNREWQLLKKLDVHNKLPTVFTDAWQRNIRKQRELQSMDAHFRDLFGAPDFERVRDFKAWVDEHPQAVDIKHYITTNFKY